MMYNFFLYSGKGSAGAENCSSEGSVMRLVKHLPQHKHHTLCFDNWFTTIPLMIKLKALGITALGTIRSNRLFEDIAINKVMHFLNNFQVVVILLNVTLSEINFVFSELMLTLVSSS